MYSGKIFLKKKKKTLFKTQEKDFHRKWGKEEKHVKCEGPNKQTDIEIELKLTKYTTPHFDFNSYINIVFFQCKHRCLENLDDNNPSTDIYFPSSFAHPTQLMSSGE